MTPSVRLAMSSRDWLSLLLLSFLWGGSFFLTKLALGSVAPFTLVLARILGAALILVLVVAASGRRLPRTATAWAGMLLLGLLNNVLPFALFAWAQTSISSGLAAILNATTPLFTALLAHVATRDERASMIRIGGIAIGFAGVAIIMGPDAFGGVADNLAAELACLAAPVSYAFAAILGRRSTIKDPMVLATGQLIAASFIMAPVALALEQPWTAEDPGLVIWAAIGALAVFSTALAYILYFRLLAGAGATNTALVTLLIPVTALLLGASLLGEIIAPRELAGMAVIGIGLALIDGRPATAALRLFRGANSR